MLSSGKIKNYLNGRDIQFFVRPNSSDEKAFQDVFVKKCYHWNPIFKTTQWRKSWLDLGGNAGAFVCLVGQDCEKITVYEPIPENCEMIRKQAQINGIEVDIICAAASVRDGQKANFYVRNDDQNWRSSLFTPLVKNKTKNKIIVDLIYPKEKTANLKLDIEGGEYDLIDAGLVDGFESFVMEYGFEIEKSLEKYRSRMSKLKNIFEIHQPSSAEKSKLQMWPQEWFPKAVMLKGIKKELLNGSTY